MKIDFIKAGLDKPVVLVGLMGAGKTSLGKILAECLAVSFVDSDDVIIRRENLSVSEIFAQKGEAYFREVEKKVISDLMQGETLRIIATGGGAFMNETTRQVIQKNALSVFLKADQDVLLGRIGTGENRPLFKEKNPSDVLNNLIVERYPVYELADLQVETYEESEEKTLNRLVDTLYTHLKP